MLSLNLNARPSSILPFSTIESGEKSARVARQLAREAVRLSSHVQPDEATFAAGAGADASFDEVEVAYGRNLETCS